MIFRGIEHQTWAYLRGEGDFSVEDSADGITDVVYRGLVPAQPAQQPDLAAATARLEKVAAALEKHLLAVNKAKE